MDTPKTFDASKVEPFYPEPTDEEIETMLTEMAREEVERQKRAGVSESSLFDLPF